MEDSYSQACNLFPTALLTSFVKLKAPATAGNPVLTPLAKLILFHLPSGTFANAAAILGGACRCELRAADAATVLKSRANCGVALNA
jgi:hypothetical protein